MAYIIYSKMNIDSRGSLCVIDNILPFEIKRVFFISGAFGSTRGMHRHVKTIQALVVVQGSCDVFNQSSTDANIEVFTLNESSQCLVLLPTDYHWMKNFSNDCILLVLASESYDPADYIYDPYF